MEKDTTLIPNLNCSLAKHGCVEGDFTGESGLAKGGPQLAKCNQDRSRLRFVNDENARGRDINVAFRGFKIINLLLVQRIWYDSPPHFQYHRNFVGKTANELFQENHVSLRESAEKALKDMNNGLMLVATLIGTVNYATLFNIPGGYVDDNNSASFGRPKFFSTKKEDQLLSFLWYTEVALFSALIALTAMLLIQLSRFTNDDFFMILPVRYLGFSDCLICLRHLHNCSLC
ncbi:uncharacterized protein LOC127790884 [Diospyros lotus]|uniref:uncharacterized protein LOC127790884 n=1 Tax=Diospyros lotus TaxID=55363 RepID=UPI002250901E|nr:uncharacterized protein LOC127790884 [Diospyros lotus]